MNVIVGGSVCKRGLGWILGPDCISFVSCSSNEVCTGHLKEKWVNAVDAEYCHDAVTNLWMCVPSLSDDQQQDWQQGQAYTRTNWFQYGKRAADGTLELVHRWPFLLRQTCARWFTYRDHCQICFNTRTVYKFLPSLCLRTPPPPPPPPSSPPFLVTPLFSRCFSKVYFLPTNISTLPVIFLPQNKCKSTASSWCIKRLLKLVHQVLKNLILSVRSSIRFFILL